MKKVVFTICSNNYLAQAKTLGDSLLNYNKDYDFIIVLCDKKSSEVDYSKFGAFKIIEIGDLNIATFDDMVKKYRITELNTSIKPFVFDYIYKNFDADIICYFDPDIAIYDNLSYIENSLLENNFVLTPHILNPVETTEFPNFENELNITGIFNLGFIATKKCKEVKRMLDWWMKRLAVGCYARGYSGAFYDQSYLIHVPVFFEGALISKHVGLNVAHWNLTERNISYKNDKFYVNGDVPLIFFHFSGYSPKAPHLVTKRWSNFVLDESKTDLKRLFDDYCKKMLENNYQSLSKISCFYIKKQSLELFLLFIRKHLFLIIKKIDKIIDYLRTKV